MKSHKNRAHIPSVPPTAVALASGLALAVLTSGPATADARTPERAQASALNAAQRRAELKSLTRVIKHLDEGGNARAFAEPIEVSGPIGTATGQPLVFSANGQKYLAYTQGVKPDFHQSPKATAKSMAETIIPLQDAGDGPPAMITAHLNGQLELVAGSNNTPVGFAMGGDAS